jgi:hypothetical protein
MGLRFRKRIRIARGIKINLSKGTPSLSIGGPGHTLNLSKRGRRVTVGLPGSGFSYSKNLDSPVGIDRSPVSRPEPPSSRNWAALVIIAMALIGLIAALLSNLL